MAWKVQDLASDAVAAVGSGCGMATEYVRDFLNDGLDVLQNEIGWDRLWSIGQCGMGAAALLLVAALLLAWGRCQQRCYTWVAPRSGDVPESREVSQETRDARYIALAVNEHEDRGNVRQAHTGDYVKAVLISVVSFLVLGFSIFVFFTSGILAVLLLLHQETGAAGLKAFLLCAGTAAGGAGVVALLLTTSLRHLRRQEVDACEFQVTGPEVARQWRMDALSRLEEQLGNNTSQLRQFRARVKSAPTVISLTRVLARLSFVWDIASDILVAQQLQEHHADLALLVLGIVALPYLALPLLLGPTGLREVLTSLHPAAAGALNRLAELPCLERLAFLLLAAPTFVLIDLDFTVQYMFADPVHPRLFHFWTLRMLVEVFWEANLQVLLQSYIGLRQENPFNVLPAFGHTSVSLLLLAASVVSSGLSSMDGLSKLTRFAELQTRGERWAFFKAMLEGGAGLAPSSILQELLQKATVEIQEDLSAISLAGWGSICLAARYSETLKQLRFVDLSFLAKFQDQVGAENALMDIFKNGRLRELELPKLPTSMAKYERIRRQNHPTLEGSELRAQLPAAPWLLAAAEGDVAPLRRQLHEDAASVEAFRFGSWTAMDVLAIYSAPRAVQLLLETQPAARSGEALVSAAEHGHAACVELLLKAGADSNQVKPQTGSFPLLMAAQNGHPQAVDLLLKAGADANKVHPQNGAFPLLMAAQDGHAQAVDLLLKAGADAKQVNPQNGTFPLLVAAQNGHTQAVDLLLKAGADSNQVKPQNGNFPLLMAAQYGHAQAVDLLLKAGADANQVHQRGAFPLLMAAQNGHAQAVDLLLKAGADANQVNPKNGTFPLLNAAYFGQLSCVELLLAARADPAQRHPEEGSPLELAAQQGHDQVVAALSRAP